MKFKKLNLIFLLVGTLTISNNSMANSSKKMREFNQAWSTLFSGAYSWPCSKVKEQTNQLRVLQDELTQSEERNEAYRKFPTDLRTYDRFQNKYWYCEYNLTKETANYIKRFSLQTDEFIRCNLRNSGLSESESLEISKAKGPMTEAGPRTANSRTFSNVSDISYLLSTICQYRLTNNQTLNKTQSIYFENEKLQMIIKGKQEKQFNCEVRRFNTPIEGSVTILYEVDPISRNRIGVGVFSNAATTSRINQELCQSQNETNLGAIVNEQISSPVSR